MYSASSKAKLEAAATVAATLILAAAPLAALAAIQRHQERPAGQPGRTEPPVASLGSKARQ
jgi:hypothetical protein